MSDDLIAGLRDLGYARCKALMAEKATVLEQEINILPLHLELLCYCIKDVGLRDSLVRFGRTNNFLDKAPASMQIFLFELRDIDLRDVFTELEKSEYDGSLPY